MTPQVFLLPDLGEGLAEAELVRWLVAVGDTISVDAPVAEVETAKAMVEVPSPFAGRIVELHGSEGSTLTVGEPLVSVAGPEADGGADRDAGGNAGPGSDGGSGNVLIGFGTSGAPVASRRRAARTQPVAHRAGDARPGVISPIVRKLARSHGLDLAAVRGTGERGVITRRDVEAAIAVPPPPAPPDTGTDARTGQRISARVPLTGLRKAAVATLQRSRSEIPEATTWVDVDATALVDFRASLAEPLGLLAIVSRFVVAGLARFPELNARVDVERGEIVLLDGVNLGIAAQTDRGLVVPAVRDAHRLSMRGLDAEIRRLTAAARTGTATAAELSSGSFTLNNYGVLGVDGSAAIINHPEVAILGMGRIIARPWVVDGQIVPRQITQLSLVFDHRVCDGGTAGGFLRHVADCVESPLSALADL